MVGQPAYAVEQVSCEGASGNWLLLFKGVVEELSDKEVVLTVAERISLRYWPDAEGVDRSDWFCVPRRRFCYSTVAFTDWRGTVMASDRLPVPRDLAFHENLGLVVGAQPILDRECDS